MSRWHVDTTHYDIVKTMKMAVPHRVAEPSIFYKGVIDATIEQFGCIQKNGLRMASAHCTSFVAEALWIALGRPRWFVDATMFEILADTKIDPDLTQIPMPYDCFDIVFEKGCVLSGYEVRWIRVMRASSVLADNILTKYNFVTNPGTIFFQVDVGEVDPDNGFPLCWWTNGREDGVFEESSTENDKAFDREHEKNPRHSMSNQELKAFGLFRKLARTAVLYWRARPELIVSTKLERQDRAHIRGARDCMSRVKLPTEKRIIAKSDSGPISSTVKPHFRGFVLRTLRDARYSRNSDGSPKTILIAPCAIHPELMEETA